jgi:CubicO group peptidase (beta-lactamase class C family)
MNRFRHLCSLLAGLVLALPVAAKSPYDTAALTAEVQGIVAAHALPGVSLRVNRRGTVQYQQSFGGYTPATQAPIASASKWLSALVLARLVEKGDMDWNDSVGKYMPDAPLATRGITLRQLFSHTSGMAPTENACIGNPFASLDACARQILAQPLPWAPGSTFAYGGNSMHVAGRLAEIATGKSWDQVFIDELVQPLGLAGTDFASSSQLPYYVRLPNPRIAGGARSTIIDYGIVVDMVLAGGLHRGQRFLRRETLDYMALDHAAGTAMGYTPFPESHGYGIGQWREAVDAQGVAYRVSSPGAFGTTPWVDRRAGLAGVFLVRGQWSQLREDIFDLQALCQAVFQTRHAPPAPYQPAPQGMAAPVR